MSERTRGTRHTDDWLRAAETAFGIGFWSWDVAESRFSCSQGFFELLGMSPQAMTLDPSFLETLAHPHDRLTVDDPSALALDPRQADRRYRIIRPDGQLRCLRSVARSFFDREGAVTRVIAAIADVSEINTKTRRIAHLEALLHAVSELSNTALWIVADNGQLLDRFNANEAIDLMGKSNGPPHWRNILHPDDLERVPETWKEALRTRKMYRFHGRMLMADGEYRNLHAVALPFDQRFSSELLWGGISSTDTRFLSQEARQEDHSDELLTPGQVRACRALLDWTAETLANKAGISVSTVRRLESTEVSQGQGDSMRLVMIAFREAGLRIWRGEDGNFCVSDHR